MSEIERSSRTRFVLLIDFEPLEHLDYNNVGKVDKKLFRGSALVNSFPGLTSLTYVLSAH